MEALDSTFGHMGREHLDLIATIYDLPLRPEGWHAVLDQFAPMMGAKIAGIAAVDPVYAENRLNVMSSNFPLAAQQEYHELFAGNNDSPFIKMIMNPKRAFLSDLEMTGLDTVEQYAERPTVQWLKQKLNLFHGAASCLNVERAWSDILLVIFQADRGPVTEAEKKTGSYFLDHFAKSTELGRTFSVLKSRFNSVFTALDRLHIGIIILTPAGNVVVKNTEAERILEAGDGLTVSREGQLHPADEGQRAALKEATLKASRTARGEDNQAETLLTLSRRSGGDSYLVEISPIRDDDELESRFRGSLVFVIDPAKTDAISTDGMKALYNLTDTESEVCKLVAEGLGTEDMAETRNITRETVRNYIKQVLHKTGVKNRAQLVRLALKVNLPIDPA